MKRFAGVVNEADFAGTVGQNDSVAELTAERVGYRSDTDPERAPTIRSVPEMVLVKRVRASWQIRSTPNKRATPKASETNVSVSATVSDTELS